MEKIDLMLKGYRLTTAEILYHMPDHPKLLQSFVWQELDLEPQDGGGSRVTATAYWQPAGPSGFLYWWALFPAHLFIFDNMTRNICKLAEERELLAAF